MWFYWPNTDQGEPQRVFRDATGETWPMFVHDDTGITTKHKNGSWSFVPWSSLKSIWWAPADA